MSSRSPSTYQNTKMRGHQRCVRFCRGIRVCGRDSFRNITQVVSHKRNNNACVWGNMSEWQISFKQRHLRKTQTHTPGWAQSFPHADTLLVHTLPDSSLDPCMPPSCICNLYFSFLTLRAVGRAGRPGGNGSAGREKQEAISTRFLAGSFVTLAKPHRDVKHENKPLLTCQPLSKERIWGGEYKGTVGG